MIYIFIIWILSIIFNVIITFIDFRKNYNFICLKDIILFIFAGVFLPFILNIVYIEQIWSELQYKQIKNPFYKGE